MVKIRIIYKRMQQVEVQNSSNQSIIPKFVEVNPQVQKKLFLN